MIPVLGRYLTVRRARALVSELDPRIECPHCHKEGYIGTVIGLRPVCMYNDAYSPWVMDEVHGIYCGSCLSKEGRYTWGELRSLLTGLAEERDKALKEAVLEQLHKDQQNDALWDEHMKKEGEE